MSSQTGMRPDVAPIQAGLEVFTADNRRLGRVKDFSDTHFKVDVRFGRDYWLARDRAIYIDERCVGMHFRKDELELYRLSDPFGTEFSARQPADIGSTLVRRGSGCLNGIPGDHSRYRARFPLQCDGPG